jgi:prepilin-type N-terminal cleavage/methylation domain-containing protein
MKLKMMKIFSTRDSVRDRQRGLGLVELLVAMAVAGIIMVVVAAFFAFQSRVARDTQARNEINVRARAVAEADHPGSAAWLELEPSSIRRAGRCSCLTSGLPARLRCVWPVEALGGG